ncbi:MAG: Gfo/Idh/MocA family oxidoreductase [Coprobacillus sp.]
MKKICIGIICPSEIAFRRFMPALCKLSETFSFGGVAIANEQEWNGNLDESIKNNELKKAQNFVEQYGGIVYRSYMSLLEDKSIDAVYLPLPPALHYQWAKLALENNKHVLIEKPSTICVNDTKELVELALSKNLALHENYMFIYHNQIKVIQKLMEKKTIGDIRLIRADFGFPKRADNDFRYNKSLGGGALFDCGGYPIRLLSLLMGDIHVDSSKLIYNEQGIDLYGSAQVSTENQVAQLSFGMDNDYRCNLEIWGSCGTMKTNRIFSAPDNFTCHIDVEKNHQVETIKVDSDDTFEKSILEFSKCILKKDVRQKTYSQLNKQIRLVEDLLVCNKGKTL